MAAGLLEARRRLGRHERLDGVVERSKVRVQLLAEVAGQEPEAFARLHHRAGYDELAPALAAHLGQRLGHREVGLARARRDRCRRPARAGRCSSRYRAWLVRAGVDVPVAAGNGDGGRFQSSAAPSLPPVSARCRLRIRSGPGSLPQPGVVLDLLQERPEGARHLVVAGLEQYLVAPWVDPHPQELLDHPQVAVVGTADLGKDRLVPQDDGQRLLHSPPKLSMVPGEPRRGQRRLLPLTRTPSRSPLTAAFTSGTGIHWRRMANVGLHSYCRTPLS